MSGLRQTDNGLGSHCMWGFGPAVDVQELYGAIVHGACSDDGCASDEPLNVLLAHMGDVRHVLKTLAQRRRHPRRPLHFYVVERPLEVVARDMLLLQILHEWDMPIRQRAHLFLEVFGNSLVQDRTSKLIACKAADMIDVLCNGRGDLADLLDFSMLKYRERDELETIFKSWGHAVAFDAAGLRDQRMRSLYLDRYDFRVNVMDWDYQWGLRPHASIVHSKHFRTWRDTGVAFEFGDQTYTVPNRTMATYASGKEKGRSVARRGFWLDIVVGPYIALGVDCDRPNKFAEDLFLIHNKGTGTEQHRHNAVEVSVYNMLSFLHEIETGAVYTMKKEHQIYSGLGEALNDRPDRPGRPGSARKEEDGKEAEEDGEDHEDESAVGKRGEEQSGGTAEEGPEDGSEKRDDGAGGITAVVSATAELVAAGVTDARRQRQMKDAALRAENIMEAFDNVKITLLGGDLGDWLDKPKKRLQGLFHCALLSSTAAHHLKRKELASLMRPAGALVVETPKYLIPVNKEGKAGFVANVREIAAETGLAGRGEMVNGKRTGRTGCGTGCASTHADGGGATTGEAKGPGKTKEAKGDDEELPVPDYLLFAAHAAAS